MQRCEYETQPGQQTTALGALAEVVLHSAPMPCDELPIEVCRHLAGSPPVVAPEAQSVQELAHYSCDPLGRRTVQALFS
jgi:hypothetical protein